MLVALSIITLTALVCVAIAGLAVVAALPFVPLPFPEDGDPS